MTRPLGKSGTTDLQAERLAWIVQALALTGFPPTVAELARHFYITVSSANDTVRALRYNGLLTRKTLAPTKRAFSLIADRRPHPPPYIYDLSSVSEIPDKPASVRSGRVTIYRPTKGIPNNREPLSSPRPVLETRAGHLSVSDDLPFTIYDLPIPTGPTRPTGLTPEVRNG